MATAEGHLPWGGEGGHSTPRSNKRPMGMLLGGVCSLKVVASGLEKEVNLDRVSPGLFGSPGLTVPC